MGKFLPFSQKFILLIRFSLNLIRKSSLFILIPNSFSKFVDLKAVFLGCKIRFTPIPIAKNSKFFPLLFRFSIKIPAHFRSLIIISLGHFNITLKPLDFLYKSVDGGDSWEKIYNETYSDISVHSIDISLKFSEDQSLIIGTNLGAFKSIDGGGNWISMYEGLPVSHKMISSVKIASDGTMFIGLPNEGIFKSDDSGRSWDQRNFGLFNDYVSVIDVSPNFSNAAPAPTPIPVPQTLYFSEESWNVLGYVFGILALMVLILAVIYRKALIRFLSTKKEISGNATWNEILKNTSSKPDEGN